MQRCLQAIDASSDFELGLVVTGQHLSPHYGDTAAEIRSSGLNIACELPVDLQGTDGAEMARALARELSGFTDFWESTRPDLVLLLGDRGEMVAAALAAVHLGIFVAHIHGGERSGTLDESFRHVITKLAHYHFPATEDAAERLRRMGEDPDTITVIGAPGLVGITEGIEPDPKWLAEHFNLSLNKPIALVLFHPVVQEASIAGEQIQILIETLLAEEYDAVIFRPNSDAGGQAIDRYLDQVSLDPRLCVVSNLDRDEYLKIMSSAKLMIGNSSSGIIESASLGIPCVNLGTRQDERLRNENTVDCREVTADAIRVAIKAARALPHPFNNRYGDGKTDLRLAKVLSGLDLTPERLKKRNAY
jgi:UDP-hydrolysing UDP-N-acetyl-D-glucosamine 2-epimerase